MDREINESRKTQKRSFVPSLTLSYFSTYLMDFLVGIFLADVTLAFFGTHDPLHVAITSQLATISSATGVITGIGIAILSVRFSRKLLLMIGASLIPIGIIGCILAPSFLALEIFFPFDGIGSIMVGSMVFAIAGETLPLSKRAKAIGLIASGATWAQFIGALLVRYFFPAGDWRSFLTWYALPVSMTALILVYFSYSLPLVSQTNKIVKESYFSGFKSIFTNRSATACLVGNMTRHAGMIWGIVYAATFFRIIFDLPLPTYAIFVSIGTLLFALGSIIGGQIADKIGRKRLVITFVTLAGLSTIAVVYVPNLWVALVFGLVGNLCGGLGSAGTINMTVEQVPQKRGTIMSMSTVFVTLGATIGAAIGGVVLAFSGSYQVLALSFAAFTFASAAIYLFLTKDPCHT